MGTAVKPDHHEENRQHLHDTLKEAGTVMMLTRGHDGSLHGRPMAVAKIEADDTLIFATSIRSTKVLELERDARVDLVFQSKTRYATLSGTARITQDRALVEQLWSETWKVWFPEGKDDPEIALVIVAPDRGEYWDQSGAKGLAYLFRAAKAYVTGTKVDKVDAEVHGVVKRV